MKGDLLKEYNRKRDFKITREPSGKKTAKKKSKKLVFVVQEHHASQQAQAEVDVLPGRLEHPVHRDAEEDLLEVARPLGDRPFVPDPQPDDVGLDVEQQEADIGGHEQAEPQPRGTLRTCEP